MVVVSGVCVVCADTVKIGSESLPTMRVLGTTCKGIIIVNCSYFTGGTDLTCQLIFSSILQGRKLFEYPGLGQFCEELFSKHIRSPFLLAVMVDMCEERAKDSEHAQENQTKALEVSRYILS